MRMPDAEPEELVEVPTALAKVHQQHRKTGDLPDPVERVHVDIYELDGGRVHLHAAAQELGWTPGTRLPPYPHRRAVTCRGHVLSMGAEAPLRWMLGNDLRGPGAFGPDTVQRGATPMTHPTRAGWRPSQRKLPL